MSVFVGTVPVLHWLLQPYTQAIRSWGWPRLNVPRLVGLIVLLPLWLVPLGLLSRRDYPPELVAAGLAVLALCGAYLWFRFCWLLDAHKVRSPGKELLFCGVLLPLVPLLGLMVGNGTLGVGYLLLAWPEMVISHALFTMIVAAPLGWGLYAGVRYTFGEPDQRSEKAPAEDSPPAAAEPKP